MVLFLVDDEVEGVVVELGCEMSNVERVGDGFVDVVEYERGDELEHCGVGMIFDDAVEVGVVDDYFGGG